MTRAVIPQALRPMLARCLPFGIYIAFLVFASWLYFFKPGIELAHDLRWLYAVQITAVVAALVHYRRDYLEFYESPQVEIALWGQAFLLGLGIFVVWINLDRGWVTIGELKSGFVPINDAGSFDWPLIVVRILGAAAVVPVMEELFWRSFVQRWIDRKDFHSLAPAAGSLRALLLTSVVFGFEHSQWLAGIFAGLAYGWLYRRSGSLWPPIVAHSLTNLLLGVWVVNTGQWQFW